MNYFFLIVLLSLINVYSTEEIETILNNSIEGKVINQYTTDEEWFQDGRILIDGGIHIGRIRSDGNFFIQNLPSGSYILEVAHPLFFFDLIRIDISSRGKIRARPLDNIQPFNSKNILPYPVKIRCRGRIQYFQQREEWRVSDFLFNPMVLMMFLPLLVMFLLPKLLNTQDPQVQKEMQQSMNIFSPKQEMPDISEVLTNFLGSGSSKSSSSTSSTTTIKKSKIKSK